MHHSVRVSVDGDQAKLALAIIARSIKLDDDIAKNLRLTCKATKESCDALITKLNIPCNEYGIVAQQHHWLFTSRLQSVTLSVARERPDVEKARKDIMLLISRLLGCASTLRSLTIRDGTVTSCPATTRLLMSKPWSALQRLNLPPNPNTFPEMNFYVFPSLQALILDSFYPLSSAVLRALGDAEFLTEGLVTLQLPTRCM